MEIFNSSSGYAGYFGPSPGSDNVAVTIARGGTNIDANNGFLADGYRINWGRSVSIKRVFNNDKPIAIVGYGQGTVTLQGLLGTYEGFANIVGDKTNTNEDLCDPLVITINGTGGYSECVGSLGLAVPASLGGVNFELTGCILSNLDITGQIESQSGTMLQQATVSFNIGGFKINK